MMKYLIFLAIYKNIYRIYIRIYKNFEILRRNSIYSIKEKINIFFLYVDFN